MCAAMRRAAERLRRRRARGVPAPAERRRVRDRDPQPAAQSSRARTPLVHRRVRPRPVSGRRLARRVRGLHEHIAGHIPHTQQCLLRHRPAHRRRPHCHPPSSECSVAS